MEKITRLDFDTWMNFLDEMKSRKATQEEFESELLERFNLTVGDTYKSPRQLEDEGRI